MFWMSPRVAASVSTILVGAGVLAWLSLRDVPGVVTGADDQSATVTFVHTTWWMAYLLLAVPLFLIARSSLPIALLAMLIATGGSLGVAYETVHRYTVSGASDGLEILSYVFPVIHLFVYLTTLVLALLTRPKPTTTRQPATS